MNIFTQQLHQNLLSGKDKKALIYSDGNAYSYAELDQLSGRTAAWLRDQGIGKEDVVMITMPRGIQILAAMVGVIRTGACFVICESSMAPERIRYITDNSKSKKIIDLKNWETITSYRYSEEFTFADEHDAAYIVYTSGTTGNPKGVVHEYGNYDQSVLAKRIDGKPNCQKDDTLGLNSPLNFVAAVDYIVNALYAGAAILLVETNIVKNVSRLMELYEKYGVTYTFMTPSLYRSIPEFSSSLKTIQLGGEPCVNLYNDRIRLLNGYNMSEAGRDMMLFVIDKPYSTTPTGHNNGGEEILLLNEDGLPVPDGEIGEVCFANQYVRGYLGMPEKTAEAWKDGIFHTGDLARRENGEFYLLGRKDDMIKINGNRIEPAEIESVAKKLLGLTQVIVKGFISRERNFIVLYYTDDIELDPDTARAKLSQKLTSYMLPSYFVHLDEVPLLPNGKINKKVLEAPSLDSFRHKYEAAVTETEKALAALFEEILDISHIGVNDDFYELGGDSLKTIRLIMKYDKNGLDAQTVFKCRTVRRIAHEIELNLEELQSSGAMQFETDYDKEMYARTQKYQLTDFQTNMFDYQLYEPKSLMWNLEDIFSFDLEKTDADRLYDAVKTVADHTSIFRTRVKFDECCDLVEYIDDTAQPAVERIYISDKEFEDIKNKLNHSFMMLGSPYIEAKVFQTESRIYLHLLSHHMIVDGKGIEALLTGIAEVYQGRKLPLDTFYSYLWDTANIRNSRKYREAKNYFEQTYGNKKWHNCPQTDKAIKDHSGSAVQVNIPISEDMIRAAEEKTGLSRNGLVTAVLLLMMSAESGEKNVLTSWVYHQRNDRNKMNAIGLLISQLPVGVDFDELHTLKELYADINEQINAGMANSIYDWSLNSSAGFEDDTLLLVYEGSLFEWGPISEIGGTPVSLASQFGASENSSTNIRKMFVMAVEDRQGIVLNITYLKNAYTAEHIEKIRILTDKYASIVFSDSAPEDVVINNIL